MNYLLPLEVGNLDGLVAMILMVMLGPPVLFLGIGLLVRKSNPKAAKICYILAGVYMLVGLGICGGLMV